LANKGKIKEMIFCGNHLGFNRDKIISTPLTLQEVKQKGAQEEKESHGEKMF